MTTLEHPVIGPREGHANNKAVASLVIGLLALGCLSFSVLSFAFRPERLDAADVWVMPMLFALILGLIAVFLGSLGWVDVRKGVTDRNLFAAQFGTVLGGIAALGVLLVGAIVLAMALYFLANFVSTPMMAD